MHFCPQDGTKLVEKAAPENGKANADGASSRKNGSADSKTRDKTAADDELRLDEDMAVQSDASAGNLTRTLDMAGDKPASLADPRLELLGQVVEERYDITETLGKGGMSVVFKLSLIHI